MSTNSLFQPLALPNGAVLKNRIAKAAMEENLATGEHAPGEELCRLYRTWADGGAGLIITGNVMVDARAMTGPGGVIVENRRHMAALLRWTAEGRAQGAQFWMQINHPGRQMKAALRQQAIAPSVVPLELGRFSKMFASPRAMAEEDIQDVRSRFLETALIAEEAGFTGVEIHAAHGYLLSQFLSPLTNLRTDRWGGSLDNRCRLLVDILQAVRAAVSPGFCVAVKINSADFQRGGFDNAEALQLVTRLNNLGVDLVEISGGNYESPAMQGRDNDGLSVPREAYFLEFARQVKAAAKMPVMLTGGIRRIEVAEVALSEGIAVIGMATALALKPDLPRAWRGGNQVAIHAPKVPWKNKPLASFASRSLVDAQLRRLGKGKSAARCRSPAFAVVEALLWTSRRTKQYVAWKTKQPQEGVKS